MIYPYKSWKDVIWERETITTPTTQPLISLDVLKLQSRIFPDVEETAEDPLFVIYCQAAEEQVESLAEIVLRQKTISLFMDSWCTWNKRVVWGLYQLYLGIPIEQTPVTAINYIKYYDEDDAQQTFDSALYETWLNRKPPTIVFKRSDAPFLTSERTKRIECQYVAGYTGAIPAAAQLACLELVAFWFQNREMYGKLPENSAQGRVFWSLVNQLSWRLPIV